MKKSLFTAVALVGLLAMLAPAALAASMPAPKVTINGLIDQITSWSKNLGIEDSNVSRNKDEGWYARTRLRPDITAEVGTTKFVLGLEIDEVWGQTGSSDTVGNRFGASASWDLNTDTRGVIEVKWGYTQFEMPLIPVKTVVRLGAQPFSVTMKGSTLATGDFAGANVVMDVAPPVKLHLTYAQVEEKNEGIQAGFNGEDEAIILGIDVLPMKGIQIRPIFAYFFANGPTSGSARIGRGGVAGSAFVNGDHENRYTVGVDSKLTFGPFYVDPTFFYQFGDRDMFPLTGPGCGAGGTSSCSQDKDAWFVDVRTGFQLGPLLLELAGIYTTGNKAEDDFTKGRVTSHVYEVIDADSGYFAGWANIVGLGLDYFNSINYRASGLGHVNGIGYDKYGLIRVGFKPSYAITPNFTVYAAANASWTDKKVDTDGTTSNAAGLLPSCQGGNACLPGETKAKGDSRYLGTEVNLGLTYRFAPNISFELVGAYMWVGDAYGSSCTRGNTVGTAACPASAPTTPVTNGQANRDPDDIATVAARVRFTF